MGKPDYKAYSPESYPLKGMDELNIVILRTEWNDDVVGKINKSCVKALKEAGIKKDQIHLHTVPGSFELPMGVKMILTSTIKADAIICLGCVIQGETKHDDYINHTIARSINNLNLASGTPVIFGVLTTNTKEQALARAGGERGDKGHESAMAALKMISLKEQLSTKSKKISF